jgi:formylglycine-generating enzyme required for sulfatase activity
MQDVSSLGVTCIHLLTNVPPFDLFDIGEDRWVWRDYLVNNPVDDLLGKVLDGSIVNALTRRYHSATEVLFTLNAQKTISVITGAAPQDQVINLKLEPFSFNTAKLQTKENFLGRIQEITVVKSLGQANRFIEDLGNDVKLEMVAIPGGDFLMGSPVTEKGSSSEERPQHQVKIPSFYMGRYPVTQSQYEALMCKNPSHFTGENFPVEKVSWHDAQAYCQKLMELSNKKYVLPSEAQWEYACRAGTNTPFHFGETINTYVANYHGNYVYESGVADKYLKTTTSVEFFDFHNDFGLSNMHGNVCEWCEDNWHDSYNGAPTDGSSWVDSSDLHVLRGGSWDIHYGSCRSAYRHKFYARLHDFGLGFRLAYIP